MNTKVIQIFFNVQLEVLYGTDLMDSCSFDRCNGYNYFTDHSYHSFDTFCPSNSSDYSWKLCYLPHEYGYNSTLQMTFTSYAANKMESRSDEKKDTRVCIAITWLSQLHGIFPFFGLFNSCPFNAFDPYEYEGLIQHTSVSMTLVMDTLECNPLFAMCFIRIT